MSRRDDVLNAAFELLDEVGLDALTVRGLAERVGVQPGALYRHFASKQALLAAMTEQLIVTRQAAETGGDWPAFLRSLMTTYRETLLRHRDGARLVATSLAPDGAGAREGWEHCIAVLRAAGFDAEAAEHAIDTAFAYTNGFTIEEQSRDGFAATPEKREWRDRGFSAGIELLIAGIETEQHSAE